MCLSNGACRGGYNGNAPGLGLVDNNQSSIFCEDINHERTKTYTFDFS